MKDLLRSIVPQPCVIKKIFILLNSLLAALKPLPAFIWTIWDLLQKCSSSWAAGCINKWKLYCCLNIMTCNAFCNALGAHNKSPSHMGDIGLKDCLEAERFIFIRVQHEYVMVSSAIDIHLYLASRRWWWASFQNSSGPWGVAITHNVLGSVQELHHRDQGGVF